MVTSITSVAVVGAGYMGGGIAQSFALAGLPVTIADASADATQAAYERLLAESQEFEDEGLYDAGATEAIRGNLRTAASIEEAVADVDFVEEAVFESVEVKHDVLGRISAAARPDAIIGSNTSTIPARVLATAVTNPERFLTVHFSNPAPFIPGVELVPSESTDPAVVPVVRELLGKADRQGALVADVPGFVLNRLQYVLLKEAMSIAEEGIASPEDIDTVVRTTFGFRLGFFGPFAIADQAGLDVYAGGFRTFEENFGERLATPRLVQEAVENDRKGVKNGKGLTKDYTPEEVKALVAYRNKAYSEMGRLLRTLGPSPA
ncbi:3-hydroxyacyl-CoA dehydrogenase family protein [Promicromonospora citrea]|uniref:3-hydroxyacyl-CoA dehydrogenase n=1 Tax=Promicromonospora citrea TaxID=43677 RepID=A0A8H9GIA2_9MICO|nr:3-hydroxyacyl-CoA dehydrogenase family protein [Promicromonospora citrea]NNH51032.1 3-hydroxyacyl-CoA dehydrogenase family protein [Promicromonospora citrea]GGM29734.1 3-hydroxyacyl-CoA dehydrogenase [Promicromonospora citrea]